MTPGRLAVVQQSNECPKQRLARDERLRPVDGVQHPRPLARAAVAFFAVLLAQDSVRRVPFSIISRANSLGLAIRTATGSSANTSRPGLGDDFDARAPYLRMTAPAASASSSAKAERSSGTSAMLLPWHTGELGARGSGARGSRRRRRRGSDATWRSVWAPGRSRSYRLVQPKELACGLRFHDANAARLQLNTETGLIRTRPAAIQTAPRVSAATPSVQAHTDLCTTSALQPRIVARPHQAVQTMDSFLRWWRGGSNGERRTINTTPAAALRALHRKRRNEGVSHSRVLHRL